MRWVPPAHSPLEWSDLPRVIGSSGRSQAQARDAIRLRFGARVVLLCDSGTSALTMALDVAASTHPGAIALPAYSCFDLATAISASEDAVMLYDIDPLTLAPDEESLARVLKAGARRVVVAPLYGLPLNWDVLLTQCSAAGAMLIEDAAQGSGAEWKGEPHGALGEIALMSFGRGKGRSAGGGGALLARSVRTAGALRAHVRIAQNTGGGPTTMMRLAAQLTLSAPSRFGFVAAIPAFGIGDTPLREPSLVAAMPDAQASIVPVALAREAEEIDARRAMALRWLSVLPASLRAATVAEGGRAGYLRFPVVRSQSAPLTLAERRLGIAAAYPKVLADLAPVVARRRRGLDEPLSGARMLVDRLVTLPTHSLLQRRDHEAITRWLEAQR